MKRHHHVEGLMLLSSRLRDIGSHRWVGMALIALVLLSGCAHAPVQNSTGEPDSCPLASCPPTAHSVDMRLGTGTHPVRILVEPDDGVKEVVKAINGAQHSVLASAYILSQHGIARALQRAASEGVAVYVLLEHHPFGIVSQPDTEFSKLSAAGIHVKWAPSYFVYAHSKFMVLDDAALLLSSANFSLAGFTSDRDFVVEDHNALDVREADNIFRADWDRIAPVLNDPNLIASPSNSRAKLRQLLARARSSIDLYSEEVLDPATVRQLAVLSKRNVRIRILTATISTWARRLLVHAGAHIHSSGYRGLYIHAKAFVIDGREAFIGSENLSATSLDDNRELGILISDRSGVSEVERTFSRDWGNGPSAGAG